MTLPRPALLLVTDRLSARLPLADIVAEVCAGGCRWVMMREKDLDTAALAALATEIVEIGRRHAATVLVNGNAEAARAAGAAGVHLPQGRPVDAARAVLGAGALIGVSAHSLAEAGAAARDGADYVTLSPVFPTKSKPGYGPALGLDEFARIARAVAIPVLALGGVTAENAASCLAAGAAGIAVMGTIMRAPDPRAATASLLLSLKDFTTEAQRHREKE